MVLGIVALQTGKVLQLESCLKYTPGNETSVVDTMRPDNRGVYVAVRNA